MQKLLRGRDPRLSNLVGAIDSGNRVRIAGAVASLLSKPNPPPHTKKQADPFQIEGDEVPPDFGTLTTAMKVPHGITSLGFDTSISVWPGRHFSAAFIGATPAMADASTASGADPEDRIFVFRQPIVSTTTRKTADNVEVTLNLPTKGVQQLVGPLQILPNEPIQAAQLGELSEELSSSYSATAAPAVAPPAPPVENVWDPDTSTWSDMDSAPRDDYGNVLDPDGRFADYDYGGSPERRRASQEPPLKSQNEYGYGNTEGRRASEEPQNGCIIFDRALMDGFVYLPFGDGVSFKFMLHPLLTIGGSIGASATFALDLKGEICLEKLSLTLAPVPSVRLRLIATIFLQARRSVLKCGLWQRAESIPASSLPLTTLSPPHLYGGPQPLYPPNCPPTVPIPPYPIPPPLLRY